MRLLVRKYVRGITAQKKAQVETKPMLHVVEQPNRLYVSGTGVFGSAKPPRSLE